MELSTSGDHVVVLDDATLLDGLVRLRRAAAEHRADPGGDLVVDIAGVARLSSATVAALLWTKRHCRLRGRRVVVRGPSRASLAVLERAGLAGVLDLEDPARHDGSRATCPA